MIDEPNRPVLGTDSVLCACQLPELVMGAFGNESYPQVRALVSRRSSCDLAS